MGLTVHFEVLNQLGTPMMYSDTLANRPAAGITGRIFFRTDSPYGIFRDTGTAWDQISGPSTFSGSLATGQVAFGSATNTIAGSNNLFWNNSTAQLGIGIAAPIRTLDVNGQGNFRGILFTPAGIFCDTALARFSNVTLGVNTGSGPGYLQTEDASQPIAIRTGSAFGGTERLRVTPATGNLLLGTTVDSGYRFNCAGSAFFSGPIVATQLSSDSGGIYYTRAFSHSATPALSISAAVTGNSISDMVYCSFFDNNGFTDIGTRTASYLQITSGRNPGSAEISATGTINYINLATDGASKLTNSSTGTYNGINIGYRINRTGAGIMRGFYYNPIVDNLGGSVHNAIQTTSGNVLFGTNFFWDNTNGSLGVGTNSIYTPTAFNLDVNGGLLIKNTAGRTAQLTLINANPALGGNNGFLVNTVGGTSGSSYVDLQGYYGTSITGSTALRLNPAGGPVIINSTTNSGEQVQITGTLRVNGQISGSAGGNSGQHLIINCDGVSYKIALLNP